MFWNRKSTVVEDEANEPDQLETESEEWLELAKELGIGAAPRVELESFLRSEGISVYRTQDVFDYLTHIAKNQDKPWQFWPLRECDAIPTDQTIWASATWPDRKYYSLERICPDTKKCFREVVPLPVLLTAKKLVDKFGDRLRMFVLVDAVQDPFLAVSVDNCSMRIVERWNEPAFRETE